MKRIICEEKFFNAQINNRKKKQRVLRELRDIIVKSVFRGFEALNINRIKHFAVMRDS